MSKQFVPGDSDEPIVTLAMSMSDSLLLLFALSTVLCYASSPALGKGLAEAMLATARKMMPKSSAGDVEKLALIMTDQCTKLIQAMDAYHRRAALGGITEEEAEWMAPLQTGDHSVN